MRIALDPWVLNERFRSAGTYVYAKNVMLQLRELAGTLQGIEFRFFSRNGLSPLTGKPGFEPHSTRLLGYDRLWRIGGLNLAARHAHADVVFSPQFQVLPLGSIPFVCTIHDATPVLSPAWTSRGLTAATRFFMSAAARLSRAIITVSEWSKKDLIEVYRLPESKIKVIYHGYNHSVFNTEKPACDEVRACRQKFGISRDYIFHHGLIQPRKNLVRLVQAYRDLISRRPDLDLELVLAGRIGWESGPLLAEVEKTNRGRGKVVFTRETSESELGVLVKGARLEVIPSLYEGFCLPMIEAMACGTPTVAAQTSCLPEVSGGVLKYFDPLSVAEISGCMEQVLEDSQMQAELSAAGRTHAERFTWESCAKQTLDVILGAGSGHS